jgi:hypothetical protein
MPSGPDGNHLFILLNDPKVFDGYGARAHVVLVCVSSIRDGIPHDTTCELESGCHVFVKRSSYVLYRHARIEAAKRLEKLVEQGVFKPHSPVSPELLERVKRGLRSSPFATREFKEFDL